LRHTLLDAVLAGLAIVVDLAGNAFDALVVVVLGAVALLRVAALYDDGLAAVPFPMTIERDPVVLVAFSHQWLIRHAKAS
jgi:hypothetical protein